MEAHKVKKIATQWINEYASQTPGFYGAHFSGGINRMPDNAQFPLYKDVDIYIVVDSVEKSGQKRDKLLYHNLILESVFFNQSEYKSPELILSDPFKASNMAASSVISDPTGNMTKIQKTVAHEYTRRKWVRQRCERVKQMILGVLDSAELPFLMFSTLLAAAHLRDPTIRKAFCQMRELLQAVSRSELYDAILRICRFADVSREKVEFLLQECLRIFDRAAQVVQTPFFGSWQLHSFVRPYILEGAREMIQAGYHREAIWWIELNRYFAHSAIQNDATEEEKAYFQKAHDGLWVADSWPTDSELMLTQNVAEQLFTLVDEVIADHPNIRD